ncbi:uncharacterized protein LOC142764733 [Rhipicephalus microplus]|uniref:uncharacterized protein LOC142764733 n=1 Tax=Rhipicephalus microplus TaxID=6941 RepID=UPI003F6D4C93
MTKEWPEISTKFSPVEIFNAWGDKNGRSGQELLQRRLTQDDHERLDDVFRELSSRFPAAVPHEVSADDFVEADSNVQDLPDEALATGTYLPLKWRQHLASVAVVSAT